MEMLFYTSSSCTETLEQVNRKAYPNICTVLQLLLVVPVTAATVERQLSHKVCKDRNE